MKKKAVPPDLDPCKGCNDVLGPTCPRHICGMQLKIVKFHFEQEKKSKPKKARTRG